MKKNQGMTLVELMVVICIICILATVVLNVGRGVVLKSQIQSTQSTILALSNACEQYHALYYCYPWLNSNTAFEPKTLDDENWTDDTQEHKIQYLHYALEVYTSDTLDISEDPVLTQNLPKIPKVQRDGTGKITNVYPNDSFYIDAWGLPLYVCYGRNHSGDDPKGPNNQSTVTNYPNSTPLDIMSAGPNGTLDDNNSTSTNTEYHFNNAGVDDIVSWMLNMNKALKNTID